MDSGLPRISLTVRPSGGAGRVDALHVRYRLEGFRLREGGELFRVNLETVTIPFCPMAALRVTDDAGELPVAEELREEYPVKRKIWKASREPEGSVIIEYTVTPRALPEGYRSSPYFDFRAEEGGANGAGITFLAEIAGDASCGMHFSWDLSLMPAGSMGVSSHGEGDFGIDGKPDRLTNAYYAVGRVHALGDGRFGFYWISEPSFDMHALAGWTRRMFTRMAESFRDGGKPFRIFARKDPFDASGGGTALPRSYMFGYSDAMRPSADSLWNLLCHEMAHNWTRMKDEPYGECTWYLEGGAEYYSVVLPLRFGEVTPARALEEIQRRTDQYYLSPLRRLSNREAADLSWKDRRAQRIPYGRGFFYLAGLDARMRRATGGKAGMDDVALALLAAGGEEGDCGNADFIRIVRGLTGWDVTGELARMAAGEPAPPDPDSFGGLFTYEEVAGAEADTGAPAASYRWMLREGEAANGA